MKNPTDINIIIGYISLTNHIINIKKQLKKKFSALHKACFNEFVLTLHEILTNKTDEKKYLLHF